MRPSRLSRPSRNCPHQRSQSRKRLGRCRSVGSLAESPLAPSTVSISQVVVQVFLAEREERRVRPAGRVGCRPLRSPVRPRSVADLAPGLHVCYAVVAGASQLEERWRCVSMSSVIMLRPRPAPLLGLSCSVGPSIPFCL